jgi:hypothetical protein
MFVARRQLLTGCYRAMRFSRKATCVFHSLAQRFPEVCYLDLAMMSKIVGREVIHDECMVRGGHVFGPL